MWLFNGLFSRPLGTGHKPRERSRRFKAHAETGGLSGYALTKEVTNELDMIKSDMGNGETSKGDDSESQTATQQHLEQTPKPSTISTSPSRGTENIDSRRSRRGSRGLASFVALFRPRKSRRPKSPLGEQIRMDQDAATVANNIIDGCSINCQPENGQWADLRRDLHYINHYLNADLEARKASDKTLQSFNSDQTSRTICRYPSKRTSTPIALVETDHVYENPFDGAGEALHRIPSSNPFSDHSRSTSSTRQQSSEYSDTATPFTYVSRSVGTKGTLFVRYRSADDGSSSQGTPFPRKYSDDSWLAHIDQRLAASAFNEIAAKLGLEPLVLEQSEDVDRNEEVKAYLAPERKRNNSILRRIRSMRSSVHVKTQPALPSVHTLRRRKTFAHFHFRACDMSALKGKSLECLAQLGGHSFLKLPTRFAPTTLKLPSCFVATATYLRIFAPTVRNLFVDPGDLKTAARTYEYFANQVLSAEKDKDKIEMTLRSGEMPIDLVEFLNREAPGYSSSQVLGVAWAFRALLAGLPGGILGSAPLYRVLVKISHGGTGGTLEGQRSEYRKRNQSSSPPPLPSPTSETKNKAIGLAMLALTSPLQFNLICAVFGLSGILVQETGRTIELERQELLDGDGDGTALLNVEGLGRVLGALLTGGLDRNQDNLDTYGAIEREIEGQRVATMLISSWRAVNRWLRVWQRRSSSEASG